MKKKTGNRKEHTDWMEPVTPEPLPADAIDYIKSIDVADVEDAEALDVPYIDFEVVEPESVDFETFRTCDEGYIT